MADVVSVCICILIISVLGIVSTRVIAGGIFDKYRLPLVLVGIIVPNLVVFEVFRFFFGAFDPVRCSTRFKLIYSIAGILLCVFFVFVKKSGPYIYNSINSHSIVTFIATTELSVFTCCVYIPSSVILSNIDEFEFKFIDAFQLILVQGIIVSVLLILIGLIVHNEIIRKSITIVLFICTFCVYLQFNFLNRKQPVLSGGQVLWAEYRSTMLFGAMIWFVCIAALILFALKAGVITFRRTITFISLALLLMQLVSLLFMVRDYYTNLTDTFSTYSKDGEFSVGEENVVVFVVDTLDAVFVDNYLQSEYYHGEWRDFDYFDNVVSGGNETAVGGPIIFSGVEYDPKGMSYESYMNCVLTESITDVYAHKGYDVRTFMDGSLGRVNSENQCKGGFDTIGDKSEFIMAMNKVSLYSMSPFCFKRFFYGDTKELRGSVNQDSYSTYNTDFYNDLVKEGGLDDKYEKTFRLFHLYGVHAPYYNDEYCNYQEKTYTYTSAVLAGVNKEIETYLEYLKEIGVYDNTTVIITGDHGAMEFPEYYNCHPAILVKPDKAHEGLRNIRMIDNGNNMPAVYDAPCSFWNLTNLLRKLVDDSFEGMTLYDSRDDAFMPRKQTVSLYPGHERYRVIPQTGDDFREKKQPMFQTYDSYSINQFDSLLGQNFLDGAVMGETEGLQRDGDGYIAGYELQMNVRIADYSKGGVQLQAEYDRVYGKEEKLFIFVSDDCFYSIEIEGGTHGVFTVAIPEECICDKTIHIRIVAPYSVIDSNGVVSSIKYSKLIVTDY